jgi:hypothetical protein
MYWPNKFRGLSEVVETFGGQKSHSKY